MDQVPPKARTAPQWTHFNQPTYQELVKKSPFKTNSQALKQLADAVKDPLKYSNDIQRIYYVQVNPSALKTPIEIYGKRAVGGALRYGAVAGVWGKS